MKEKILKILKNKYFIVVFLFIVWMIFFDSNNLISIIKSRRELKKLEREKEYYKTEIEKNTNLLQELRSDPYKLENYAREKYFMKADDEDVFLIIEEENGK